MTKRMRDEASAQNKVCSKILGDQNGKRKFKIVAEKEKIKTDPIHP